MMYRRTTIYIILLLLLPLTGMKLEAQNKTDQKGRKTGHWIVNYPNGIRQYEADFQAGKPVGLMRRYDAEGELTAEMFFSKDSRRCDAVLYYPEGKKAAEGIFLDKDKDSIWNYYAESDGTIRIRESWKNGRIEGTVISYYPNGQISEITNWFKGAKEGIWEQYFENGEKKLSGNFNSDLKNGPYTAFYPDGNKEIDGFYQNDLFHGTWTYYDQDGLVILTLEYDAGKILNRDALIGKDEELLKKIEENTGNVPDPALGDF